MFLQLNVLVETNSYNLCLINALLQNCTIYETAFQYWGVAKNA